jgi:hypothetical protein
MLDLYEELKVLVSRLENAEIQYALCGGLALAIYGIVRSTVDIDLMIQKDSVEKVEALARELGYTMRAQPMTFARGEIEIRRISKNDPETGFWLSLDLLLVTPRIQEVWDGRQELDWEGGKIWVVSRRGLVSLKALRDSGQDRDDIQKIQEELDEN